MLGGTDVGFAEACANARSGVCVVMCQAAAGSKQGEANGVRSAAQAARPVSRHQPRDLRWAAVKARGAVMKHSYLNPPVIEGDTGGLSQVKSMNSICARGGLGPVRLTGEPLNNRGAAEPQWPTCSQRKWIMAAQRISHSPSGIL